MKGLAPHVHLRLLRRSRWRVAVVGALVVGIILAWLSAGAYVVARKGVYAHLHERLERAVRRYGDPSLTPGSLIVDERGRPLPDLAVTEGWETGGQGFRIVSTPQLGALAVLQLPTRGSGLRVVATPAQEELRALTMFLQVLIALTVTGGLLALPVGYALAGLALRPLDAAVRERSEFVALASHQLRTPLSVIRTAVELARAGRGVTRDEALITTLEQTERMEALAARLTALARAEAGSKASAERADLTRVAEAVVTGLNPAARQGGVGLALDAPGPIWAIVERDEVADVLTALVENAIRFSPRGGVVTVSIRANDARAIASVSDQGPGISPQDLPHVADAFYQGRNATGGHGLGLAIARAIVERRRGHLSIASSPGHGTVVRVTLPAGRDATG
ncbi:MAG TPA: HAMP domain-containing sensor histidine kinase [bacterium]|nr:HAMP domain-containing sensor histidine kinase [bacterium]